LDGSSCVYKWAPATFHPAAYPTLLIQTLHRFRSSELADRSDESEGTYKYVLNFPDQSELPFNIVQELLGGRIHFHSGRPILAPPYCMSFQGGSLKIGGHTTPGMYRLGARGFMILETWNGFVFCMSFDGGTNQSLFGTSRPIWKLRLDKAEKFASLLASALLAEAKKTDFSLFERGLPEGSKPEEVSVRWEHGKVEYVERELSLSSTINSFGLDELRRLTSKAPFIKPPLAIQNGAERNFEKEREYRFIFEFSASGALMPTKQQGINIPYATIQGMIESI
jgi:hypothetical protein